MEYLDTLWEKSGKPTGRNEYHHSLTLNVVDTWPQLYLLMMSPKFNGCVIDRVNVIKSPSGWYTVELYGKTGIGDGYVFLITNFDQQDIGHFKDFVIKSDIEFFGYNTPNSDGKYSKKDIQDRLDEYLKSKHHIISGNVKVSLENWVRDEF